MKNKSVQQFSKKRLALDRSLSKDEIARFIHEFQQLIHGNEGKRKLISIRVPEKLLNQFKMKSKAEKIAYQTKIIELMRKWVTGNPD